MEFEKQVLLANLMTWCLLLKHGLKKYLSWFQDTSCMKSRTLKNQESF